MTESRSASARGINFSLLLFPRTLNISTWDVLAACALCCLYCTTVAGVPSCSRKNITRFATLSLFPLGNVPSSIFFNTLGDKSFAKQLISAMSRQSSVANVLDEVYVYICIHILLFLNYKLRYGSKNRCARFSTSLPTLNNAPDQFKQI